MIVENLGNSERLIRRVNSAVKKGEKISIIIGSGLTLGKLGAPGVGSCSDIIKRIEGKFRNLDSFSIIEEELKDITSEPGKYQAAMKTLLECEGQDELNSVIKDAVLQARLDQKTTFLDVDLNVEALEADFNNWATNKGLDYLAKLYTTHKHSFNPVILTSNFDPLIEIALNKNSVPVETVILNHDGKFDNIVRHGNPVVSVVHFHGYWRGSDTLHTVKQITRQRPQLKGSLRTLLSDSVVLVIGYGGWDDVFTRTLIEVINEDQSKMNVLWTFYSADEPNINFQNEILLKKLEPSLEQRVVLYKGIDCHDFFPKLYNELNPTTVATSVVKVSKPELKTLNVVDAVEKESRENFVCDNPVVNYNWVGRENEFSSIDNPSKNVIYISGIGGQGKSGLAAEYLKKNVESNGIWEYWDWRDCKEEANRIHSKILSIIERLSDGQYRHFQFSNDKFEDIINLFFSVLKDRKIVFVFDNVDYYVDIEKFNLVGPVGLLFKEVLNREHYSKFIFTGRPYIENIATNFLSLRLEGLNIEETKELFNKHRLPISKDDMEGLVQQSNSLTNGHPLWMSLIIGQAYKGKEDVYNFMNDIKSSNSFSGTSESDILAADTVDAIWKRLSQKQQTLLRIVAETVRSESIDNLYRISEPHLKNYNKFFTAFNSLKNFNLIVTKSHPHEKDEFDLHPLVKQLIRKKYLHKEERSKFISLLVNFYDHMLMVIKNKLGYDTPLHVFERYTAKIELQANLQDFKGALSSIYEIHSSINLAGFIEEYLRICHLVFIQIEWEIAIMEEYSYFHELFMDFVTTLIEFGRYDEANNFLIKYKKLISGKGVNYIRYCKLLSYLYWYQEDFQKAIRTAEEGAYLKSSSGIDTDIDLDNQLALSLRDSKDLQNIDKAIEIFRLNESLDAIITLEGMNEEISGEIYGNVGRCFQFKRQLSVALICYKKAFKQLKVREVANRILNKGYACYWIGEVYKELNLLTNALTFYALAKCYWNKASPVRASRVELEMLKIITKENDPALNMIFDMGQWDLEQSCESLVDNI